MGDILTPRSLATPSTLLSMRDRFAVSPGAPPTPTVAGVLPPVDVDGDVDIEAVVFGEEDGDAEGEEEGGGMFFAANSCAYLARAATTSYSSASGAFSS